MKKMLVFGFALGLFIGGMVIGAQIGEDATRIEISLALQEAYQDGRPFRLTGVPLRFIPRRDGAVNLSFDASRFTPYTSQPLSIAGAGHEGP